jgi:hypothetical protein
VEVEMMDSNCRQKSVIAMHVSADGAQVFIVALRGREELGEGRQAGRQAGRTGCMNEWTDFMLLNEIPKIITATAGMAVFR